MTICQVMQVYPTLTNQIQYSWDSPTVAGNYRFFKFYEYSCKRVFDNNGTSLTSYPKNYTSYAISSSPDSIVAPTDLFFFAPPSLTRFYHVIPTDSSAIKTYTFWIVVQEDGGTLSKTEGPFTLQIKDCSGQMERHDPAPPISPRICF